MSPSRVAVSSANDHGCFDNLCGFGDVHFSFLEAEFGQFGVEVLLELGVFGKTVEQQHGVEADLVTGFGVFV